MFILILISLISVATACGSILMTYWLKDNSTYQIVFAYVGFIAICTFWLSATLLII